MAKPKLIAGLEKQLNVEIKDLTEQQSIWKVVEHLAYLDAFAAGKEIAGPEDIRRVALERIKMSVCRNTYYYDAESGAVVGLNLYSNELPEFTFEGIEGWEQLEVLNLGENKLAEFNVSAKLKNLQWLDLGDNKPLRALSLEALPALEVLDANECSLENFVFPAGSRALKKVDLSRNKIQSIEFKGDCPALEYLDLSRNELAAFELAAGFQKLAYLYLSGNKTLQELAFTDPLSGLEVLHIADCNVTELPQATILGERMTALYAANNTPKNIPYIFLGSDQSHNCLAKARIWFTEIRDYPNEKNKQVKMMLLGNGSAGKSTLLCALENGHCTCGKAHNSTHGVEIKALSKGDIVFNVWDFGGQEVYHGTHRLFMQSPAVQLILFDPTLEQNALAGSPRKDPLGDELIYDHPVEYWYETAKQLSDKSRFVFVQNKLDEGHAEDARIRNYAREQQAAFAHVSARDGSEIDVLELRMGKLAKTLPDYDMLMPASWMAVRDFFVANLAKTEPEKTITLDDYRRICTENKVNEATVDLLFDYLRHSGFLYYHEKLGDTIILDQKWALDAIYKLFDRDKSYYKEMRRRSDGQILVDQIFERFGKDYSDAQKQLFLSFMESCGICFKLNTEGSDRELSGSDVYIIPEFLPAAVNPVAEKDWQERTHDVCLFQYPLPWINRYLIEAFIARLGRKTSLQHLWRNGIQVETASGWFRVELDFAQKALIVSIERKAVGKWLKPILEALNTPDKDGWKVLTGKVGTYEPLNLEALLKHEAGHPPQVPVEDSDLAPGQSIDLQKSIEDKLQESNIRIVLFIAANPRGTTTIQYEKECGYIQEGFDNLPGEPPPFQLFFRRASIVSLPKFTDAIRKHKPHIIHFVGHGKEQDTPDGERDTRLVFHDDDLRNEELVDSGTLSDTLTMLMHEAKVPLRVMFLNACSSSYLAQQVSEKVGLGLQIISSDTEINSQNAKRFASKFYNTFCQDEDLVRAVREGFYHAPAAKKYIHIHQNGEEIPLKNE